MRGARQAPWAWVLCACLRMPTHASCASITSAPSAEQLHSQAQRHEASIADLVAEVADLKVLVLRLLASGAVGAMDGPARRETPTDRSLTITANSLTRIDKNGVTANIINVTGELHVYGEIVCHEGSTCFPEVEATNHPTTQPTSPLSFVSPDHAWDFRGCTSPVLAAKDSVGGALRAWGFNDPVCSSAGIALDGANDYISLDDWSWGGVTSFEAYVKIDTIDSVSDRIFCFGSGSAVHNVLGFHTGSSTGRAAFEVYVGSSPRRIDSTAVVFIPGTWLHYVATIEGAMMILYANGAAVASRSDGQEPAVTTRTNHFLGTSSFVVGSPADSYLDGTLAYFRMWHGTALSAANVAELYSKRMRCPAGAYGNSGMCTLCPAGKFNHNGGATTFASCVTCVDGYFSEPGSSTCVPSVLVPDHSWEFRGCITAEVVTTDAIGGRLQALAVNGPMCSSSGLVLDGADDYISLDDWSWGGVTSFEAYVKIDTIDSVSDRIFCFGSGSAVHNVLGFHTGSSTGRAAFEVYVGSSPRRIDSTAVFFIPGTWLHYVATIEGAMMILYANGAAVASRSDGQEPALTTRTNHFLGASSFVVGSPADSYLDGTLAYFRMWHGTALSAANVAELYSNRMRCPAGAYGGSGICTLCPAGKFAADAGAVSIAGCVTCANGFFSAAGARSCVESAPDPNHAWDFRGCTTPSGNAVVAMDQVGGVLRAWGFNDPVCSSAGIALDGANDYISLDDWSWGGVTSFEAYVKIDTIDSVSDRIFCFGSGSAVHNVLGFHTGSSTGRAAFEVYVGSSPRRIDSTAVFFIPGTWLHYVATVEGAMMILYANGVKVASKHDGQEPAVTTRTNHFLGASSFVVGSPVDSFLDGTLAYFRMWHGTALSAANVAELYSRKELA